MDKTRSLNTRVAMLAKTVAQPREAGDMSRGQSMDRDREGSYSGGYEEERAATNTRASQLRDAPAVRQSYDRGTRGSYGGGY